MFTLGERIRMARGKEPRETFSKKMNIGHATLKRYEYGQTEPSRAFLEHLARVQNIDLKWLITGQGSMIPGDAISESEVSRYTQKTEPDETASLLREQVSFLQAQIKTQQEYIESVKETARLTADALRRENDTLREQNGTLKKQVAILEEMLEAERRRAAKTDVNGMSAAG